MSLKRMTSREIVEDSSTGVSKSSSQAQEGITATVSAIEALISDHQKFSDETRQKIADFLGTKIVADEKERENEHERESQKESERESQRENQTGTGPSPSFLIKKL